MSARLWLWALLAGCAAPIDEEEHLAAQDADRDGVRGAEDCDGSDPNVFPGSVEWCNGIDDDCDGVVDGEAARGVVPTWPDGDGDGLGANGAPVWSCEPAGGYAAVDGDCDDGDASVGGPQLGWTDADGDGSGDAARPVVACDAATDDQDCDDGDAAVNPSASEVCNGRDDDCDGGVDVGAALATFYGDVDGDGFGGPATTMNACLMPPGWFAAADDCDDADPDRHPGAVEVCNGLDDDCDGPSDEAAVDPIAWFVDYDGDGWGNAPAGAFCDPPADAVAVGGDCDDGDAAVNPDALEVCNGGVDDDCDGAADDAQVAVGDRPSWFADADDDGFGDPEVWVAACAAPYGHVADDRDCDDAEPAVNPGGVEVCGNGLDDDCDGIGCGLAGDHPVEAGELRVDGGGAGGRLGAAIATGDLDGDGVVELILGGPDTDGGVPAAGATWLFEDLADGAHDPSGARARADGCCTADQRSGSALLATDLTDDGIVDLAIAGPGPDVAPFHDGVVFVGAWPLPGSLDAATTLTGGAGDRFGSALAAGDLDDDSATDLLVGGRESGGAGGVWLFAGPVVASRDVASADASWTGETAGDAAGAALAVGDLTGDGVADAAVGAPGGGLVYLVHGPVVGGALVDADARYTGSDLLGEALVVADLDDDGVRDLLIGAPGQDAGAVYAVAGSAWGVGGAVNAAAFATWTGAPGQRMGRSLAVGDTDGDGQVDVVVGGLDAAWRFDGPRVGVATGADATLRLVGYAGDDVGAAVWAADLDGDGLDEVLVGAPGWSAGTGAVFGFRGAGF